MEVSKTHPALSWFQLTKRCHTFVNKECMWLVTLDHAVLLVCRVPPVTKQMFLFIRNPSLLPPSSQNATAFISYYEKRWCLTSPKYLKITYPGKVPWALSRDSLWYSSVIPFSNRTSPRQLMWAKFTVLAFPTPNEPSNIILQCKFAAQALCTFKTQ